MQCLFKKQKHVLFHLRYYFISICLMLPGAQSVPLIIGGSSSIAAKILCRILGPLSIPLVSSIKVFVSIHHINTA